MFKVSSQIFRISLSSLLSLWPLQMEMFGAFRTWIIIWGWGKCWEMHFSLSFRWLCFCLERMLLSWSSLCKVWRSVLTKMKNGGGTAKLWHSGFHAPEFPMDTGRGGCCMLPFEQILWEHWGCKAQFPSSGFTCSFRLFFPKEVKWSPNHIYTLGASQSHRNENTVNVQEQEGLYSCPFLI